MITKSLCYEYRRVMRNSITSDLYRNLHQIGITDSLTIQGYYYIVLTTFRNGTSKLCFSIIDLDFLLFFNGNPVLF